MIPARVRPLLILLAFSGALLILRLFQVQVLEHELWAGEAARLVRDSHEIPYRRGRILDRAGRVLAQDEDLRSIVVVYRRFRREHPLGQVAHARSLLEGRPVPLAEAHAELVPRACELVELTPAAWRAFGRGEGDGRWGAGRVEEGVLARRAIDLAFYLRALLGLDLAQWRRLFERVREDEEERSFLELAAEVRGLTAERARAELEGRLARSLDRLGTLARGLQPAQRDGDDAPLEPLARLLAELETMRRAVEDATAAKLFAEASGFAPGRIEAETLASRFDHAWIRELLAWDRARVGEWARTVRAGWRNGWRDGQALPRLLWGLVLEPAREPGPDEFLDHLAALYQPEGALEGALAEGPLPWRAVEELAVFRELEDLFEAEVPDGVRAHAARALPFLEPELRLRADARALLPAGEGQDSFLGRLERALAGRRPRDVEQLDSLAKTLVQGWERRYQDELARALDAILRGADRDERGEDGGLLLALAGRERAAERAEFLLKDFGQRPRPLAGGEPSYDVVYLLTRYEQDFPGFEVRDLRARERTEFAAEDAQPAELLIGRVSVPAIGDLARQREESARLRELRDLPERELEEEQELLRLIGEVRLPDQVKGVEGIEGFFDPELTGRNGYYETRGLEDVFGAGGEPVARRDPVDGEDVVLTLDAALQVAAQRTLREPEQVDDEKFDHLWRANPVGAIVLLSAAGDVLAAASEPDEQSLVSPEATGQRTQPIERTLRKPTFQPPGSVFKPFVAAWALDHGLDPARAVSCGPIERGGFGYVDLRCWNPHGHGTVSLQEALVRSCNAYFAWLGETLHTGQFQELAETFGFGQPTGVRARPPWDAGGDLRRGLIEDRAGFTAPDGRELPDSLRRMAANGLGMIEATPMQLARATLALATGELRSLRLVERVGARELPPGPSQPLAISARSLDFVRRALVDVAADPSGTAHTALMPSVLGFPVAAKTGSADLESRKDEEGKKDYRKHAWVVGWVPAEKPVAVWVVFVHNTSATSSHGAIYLARQFLHQPEVLAWLAEQGVEVPVSAGVAGSLPAGASEEEPR